jgi:hypothetical protein
MEHRITTIPAPLIAALEKIDGRYSEAKTIYDCIEVELSVYVGTFGDGANASYEWFVWSEGPLGCTLNTSDEGFGASCWAFREGFRAATALGFVDMQEAH